MVTKKINLVKETTPATPVNAPAPVATPVNAPAEKTVPVVAEKPVPVATPAPVPVVDPVAVKRAEINEKIKVAKIRYASYKEIDYKGQIINPTNWGKGKTGTGKETLGDFVRTQLNATLERIISLQCELKETYFTLAPEIKALQENENIIVKNLVKNCIENMNNVVIFHSMSEVTPEIIDVLKGAGVVEIGITPRILGEALPVLMVNGYLMDMTHPQPVTVEEKAIEGLQPIACYTYYGFKKA